MSKKILIALGVLAVAVAVAFIAVPMESDRDALSDNQNAGVYEQKTEKLEAEPEKAVAMSEETNQKTDENSATIETGAKEKIPTFIYFVTNADGDAVKAFNKLKGEYDKKVLFHLMNIDENKALLENYPFVKDNTPALIMLSPTGDISNMSLKTAEYDKLKSVLDASFTADGE